MLYLVIAIPITKPDSIDEIAVQAENAVMPCLKALARMDRKKKLTDVAIISETATVVMAEFQSRAQANKTVMILSATAPSERPQAAIPATLYGPLPKETPQQPLHSLRVIPTQHGQDRADLP